MKKLIITVVLSLIATASIAQSTSHIVSPDGQYLGNFGNKYDPNSVNNKYGKYGSQYSNTSINNRYGQYGSQYSNKSPNNSYATQQPRVINKNTGTVRCLGGSLNGCK